MNNHAQKYISDHLMQGTEIKQLNPPTIAELSARQDSLIGRISALMSSLSELKSRLALMNDSQVLSVML